ncbi:DUF559 domain-containing protein, partial [Arthrobacter ulcerisalmonis]
PLHHRQRTTRTHKTAPLTSELKISQSNIWGAVHFTPVPPTLPEFLRLIGQPSRSFRRAETGLWITSARFRKLGKNAAMFMRDDLPPELASVPFTVAEARSAGLSANRIRQHDVTHVSRGLYRPSRWDFELAEAARALSAISPGAWISHVTAARLQGLFLPPWLADSDELHLSKPRALKSVHRRGVLGHEVVVHADEVESYGGMRISTRSRTWLDLARRLSLYDVVCMGDQLIRLPRAQFEDRSDPFDTVSGLRLMISRHPNLQGVQRAREALELVRVGSDSAPETFLRLAMGDAGLPDPELQLRLRPLDLNSPSADLGYRRQQIAIQYDGEHHRSEPQTMSDKRRDRAFESAGYTVLIFGKEDLADDFVQATETVRRSLHSSRLDWPAASGFADVG